MKEILSWSLGKDLIFFITSLISIFAIRSSGPQTNPLAAILVKLSANKFFFFLTMVQKLSSHAELNLPLEKSKTSEVYTNILRTIKTDNKQNKFFLENNLKLLRITDTFFKNSSTNDILDLIYKSQFHKQIIGVI